MVNWRIPIHGERIPIAGYCLHYDGRDHVGDSGRRCERKGRPYAGTECIGQTNAIADIHPASESPILGDKPENDSSNQAQTTRNTTKSITSETKSDEHRPITGQFVTVEGDGATQRSREIQSSGTRLNNDIIQTNYK